MDPDLLPLVRHRDRPEYRREIHAHVGELPLPAERHVRNADNDKDAKEDDDNNNFVDSMKDASSLANTHLPGRYPRGKRY